MLVRKDRCGATNSIRTHSADEGLSPMIRYVCLRQTSTPLLPAGILIQLPRQARSKSVASASANSRAASNRASVLHRIRSEKLRRAR